MSKTIGLLSLLFLAFFASAQSNCELRIFGTITDEHDGSSLAYANLTLINSNSESSGTSSDFQGRYEIGELCPGAYQLIVSHIGCKPDTSYLDLIASIKLDLKLEHHWQELDAVEVSDRQSNSNESRVATESIDRNQGESMAEMLKTIPGVQSFKTGSNVSKPMIGGFTSNRVQILNQGVRHINQNWGDEHAPEIDPYAYVDYKVIKGASALRYGGGAIGGIVLLEPKPMRRNNGVGGVFNGAYATNNGMYAPSLMLEGNHAFLPKFSWRAQASFKRSGNIKSPDYYQDNTGMQESNLSYGLEWLENSWKAQMFYSLNNSKIGIFSGAHLGNLTDLEGVLESGRPKEEDTDGFSYEIGRPYQLITHELIRASFQKYFESSNIKIQLNRQFNIREEFDKDLPRNQELAALDIPEFSLSLESYSCELDYEIDQDDLEWNLGGGILTRDNTVNSFIDFIPDYQSAQFHLFGVGHWKLDLWELEAGLRLDQTTLDVSKFVQVEYVSTRHEYLALSSNFNIKRSFGSSTISLAYNYAERAPAINELYSDGLHHGTASLEYGDPSLKKERSNSLRSNFQYLYGSWTINLEAYLQWINDFIYLEPDGIDLSTRGAFPVYQWRNTEAFLRGVDLFLKYDINEQLSLSQKGSILYANQGKDYLVNMPANRIEHELNYFIKKAELNMYLMHQYVAKQNRYDDEVEIVVPPDAYQLVSMGMTKDFEIKNKLNIQLGIRVNNLFNTAYRDYLNRFRFYSDEMGRDFRFNLKLKF